MLKTTTIIFCFLAILTSVDNTYSASLDELYRDVIRSDNQGYLPLFVKNRSTPELHIEKSLDQITEPNHQIKDAPSVKLSNDRRQQEALIKAKQLKWENAIKAVQQNNVTPLELEEINYRVRMGDAKAIDILAWMYTKGIGVNQDYVMAFNLYRKAEALKVPTASRNAALVYKAMSAAQRASIKN
ncbi:MAG: sel1 repeat family protein [Alphaproteobacteria bacterium]|nr:sel1 repeat family protein [Alphaproteobacteria bacterium]